MQLGHDYDNLVGWVVLGVIAVIALVLFLRYKNREESRSARSDSLPLTSRDRESRAEIDFHTAQQLVSEYLEKAERETNAFGRGLPELKNKPYVHLVVTKTIEYDFGWVFVYNTREYMETKDRSHSLVGNAPLIVDKNDGKLYITGTARPIAYYVEQYLKGKRTRA